jgi:hypothetical protein
MEKAIIECFHKTLGTFINGKHPPIFPGPQPISIERKHFKTLKNEKYVVCEKTDGVRHALVCTEFKGKKVCALLNRALEVKPVKLNFPNNTCKGTVLDGELVDGKLFMIYDAMSVYGENVMNMNLLQRLEKAAKFTSGIMRTKKDLLRIKLKNFFVTEDFKEFNSTYIPSLSYKTDGIVFTPVNDPVRIGTHETMFKWKPRDMNTIDFQLKDRGEKWGLYIQDRGVLIFQTELPKDEGNEWLKEDNIVECQYMADDKIPWWKPVGIRTDKHHPNNRRTFYRTLVNIREDIQVEEYINMFTSGLKK